MFSKGSMVVSDDYMNVTASTVGINGASEIALFDENHMLSLNRRQKKREDEVRDLLNKRFSSINSPSKFSPSKLSLNKEAKIRYLQNQIEEVRNEINRIKYETEEQIKENNRILKQEQDDFEKERKIFQEEGASIDAKYIKQIEELEKRLENCRKPLTEVPSQDSHEIDDQYTEEDIHNDENVSDN